MEIQGKTTQYLHTHQLGLGHPLGLGQPTAKPPHPAAAKWLKQALTTVVNPKSVKISLTVLATILRSSAWNKGGKGIGAWQLLRSLLTSGIAVWSLGAVVSHFCDDNDRTADQTDFGKYRPSFFLSWTLHARFIPQKYKFKYPLLYVGFPVTLKGSLGGSLFSVRPAATETGAEQPKWTYFSVDPKAYLNPTLPFEEKLCDMMIRQGLNPADYPNIYVVTTPQFFGYSFNPVSYYYLYDKHENFFACALEVNNTFGEKHVYILRADDPANPRPRAGYDFAGAMHKDFHISPFNHRSGSYVIQVRDPLRDEMRQDVHMTVYNALGTKTMAARAYSLTQAFDIVNGSRLRGLWIGVSWGWNTFMALPQTFFQAFKIWFRGGIPVQDRPEPLPSSARRKATATEVRLQRLFIKYLDHCVQGSTAPLRVTVTLPQWNIAKPSLEMVFTSRRPFNESDLKHLSLEILNPRFFHGFFNAASVAEYLTDAFILPDNEHKAAITDDFSLLETILSQKTAAALSVPSAAGNFMALLRGSKLVHAADRYFLAPDQKAHRNTYMAAVAEAIVINKAAYAEAVYYEIVKKVVTVTAGAAGLAALAVMLR